MILIENEQKLMLVKRKWLIIVFNQKPKKNGVQIFKKIDSGKNQTKKLSILLNFG